MYEGNRNRSFADRRRHAFDITSPNVTDCEHSGQTGFEQVRRSRKRPLRGGQILGRQIRSGLDKPLAVKSDTSIKPVRIGNSAGHREDVANVVSFDVSQLTISPRDALQMIASCECRDLCVCSQDNCRALLDAPNQISRHTLSQPARTDQHVHPPGCLRKKDCGLAGGISSSHHYHFFATTPAWCARLSRVAALRGLKADFLLRLAPFICCDE